MNEYQFQRDLIERDHGLRYQDKALPTTARKDFASKEWLKAEPQDLEPISTLDRVVLSATGSLSLIVLVVWFFF